MRPIFCGNFEFDARESDLERLFRRYGKVDRVDMKSGFAFVYMDDDRDAEDAIRALDRTEFGRKGRRLRVEWTKHERGVRKPITTSRRATNLKPSKTLFVINFPYHTRQRDLEKHFDPFGKLVNVRIRRNFAFVQYESQEDATKALEETNMSQMMDKVISVEYAARDDDEKKGGYSPDRRGRGGRSPGRGRRSPSPYGRERGSPDYGHGPSPVPYRRERGSPDYGRERSRSPRRGGRASPEYGRDRSGSRSRHERASPVYRERERSSRRDKGGPHRSSSQSPREKRVSNGYGWQPSSSPGYGRQPSSSPAPREKRVSNGHGRHPSSSPSPRRKRPSTGFDRLPSSSPQERGECSPVSREKRVSNGHGRQRSSSPSPRRKRLSTGFDRLPSSSPQRRGDSSPDYDHAGRPNVVSDVRDSPIGDGGSSVDDRRLSGSPAPEDRSPA